VVIIPVLVFRSDVPYNPTPAYTFLVGIVVYVTHVVKFTLIALGLLWLRFSTKAKWAEKSQFKHPIISIIAASLLLVICLFPLIFIWVPDSAYPQFSRTFGMVSWFVLQTIGLSILGLAFLYWVLLRLYIRIRAAREGKTLHVKREPKFKMDSGGLVQIAEIVTLQWIRDVGLRLEDIDEKRPDFGSNSSTRVASPRQLDKLDTPHGSQCYSPVPSELHGHHGISELGLNQSFVRNRGPQ